MLIVLEIYIKVFVLYISIVTIRYFWAVSFEPKGLIKTKEKKKEELVCSFKHTYYIKFLSLNSNILKSTRHEHLIWDFRRTVYENSMTHSPSAVSWHACWHTLMDIYMDNEVGGWH